jgi:hypothetical protein
VYNFSHANFVQSALLKARATAAGTENISAASIAALDPDTIPKSDRLAGPQRGPSNRTAFGFVREQSRFRARAVECQFKTDQSRWS